MSTTEKLQAIIDCKSAIKQAIIDKGGEVGDLTTYADAIVNLPSGETSMWTGHVDVEGLKAIGWTDEDIAYFQKHGVNWDEEDDDYYKVSGDNKALYGVLNAGNIQEYKDRIVWLPKINTSKEYNMAGRFKNLNKLIGIPMLDTGAVTTWQTAFQNCESLTCIPPLDFSKSSAINGGFNKCLNIQHIPLITLSGNSIDYAFADMYSLKEVNIMAESENARNISYSFYNCRHLKKVSGSIPTTTVTNFSYFLYGCTVLISFNPVLDLASATNISSFAQNCSLLRDIRIKNLPLNISFAQSTFLSKESLLYMIENESATSAITITLHASAYARLANDPDIVSALSNHPNVSLASA